MLLDLVLGGDFVSLRCFDQSSLSAFVVVSAVLALYLAIHARLAPWVLWRMGDVVVGGRDLHR